MLRLGWVDETHIWEEGVAMSHIPGSRSWVEEARIRATVGRIMLEDDARDRYVRPYSWMGEPGVVASRMEYERKVMERRAAGLPIDPYAA